MSRTQYVFVDYENVQNVDLDLVSGKAVVVELILGEGSLASSATFSPTRRTLLIPSASSLGWMIEHLRRSDGLDFASNCIDHGGRRHNEGFPAAAMTG
jgi:hypothetical protein